MHKIKVQVVQLEILQGLIQTQRDVLWLMMSGPQLKTRDDSMSLDTYRKTTCLKRIFILPASSPC